MNRIQPALWSLALLLSAVLPSRPATAEDPLLPVHPEYQDEQVHIRLVLRTPEQLTAFYLGRHFNRAAIAQILETCIVTPVIHNQAVDVLWLELDHWQFSVDGTTIPRLKRDYWPEKWDQADLPQAQRSTFWWTLMPETRDLRLDEGVGGSIVIPMQSTPFTMTANFHTGPDKQGKIKTVVFEDIECARDEP